MKVLLIHNNSGERIAEWELDVIPNVSDTILYNEEFIYEVVRKYFVLKNNRVPIVQLYLSKAKFEPE
jgi:hypothetical protein